MNDAQRWLEEHGDYLYAYALSRLHDETLASDLVQEALLAAWKGRASFKGQSSTRTWLVGILKHKIADHIRREIRHREISQRMQDDPTSAYFDRHGRWQSAPQPWHIDPERQTDNNTLRHALLDCVHKLPLKQRRVFQLRELAGEPATSICKELDISATHLHVLMHRARLALRACLERHGFTGKR
ncbi:MAG: sigma-70 family RNA polymerase sigma factor [Zetaproteobacteria bacterium]|nr:MAG: sigma-70 family RNA polymerase sigma factor [Zetaproteobacteria bacterium]